jgi:dihydroxyacetone synthase
MAPGLTIDSYEEITSSLPVKALPGKTNAASAVSTLPLKDSDKHDLVLRVFRCYIADLCEQFKGGHPG